MRKSFLIVTLLFACSNETVPVNVLPGSCSFPEGAYVATYTRLGGECGTFEAQSFSEEDERSWFPLALDLDDCERVVTCTDGVIEGSSFCQRTTTNAFGTLDGTLVFDTQTGTGSLELVITATNYHRSATCNSSYDVTYSE